MSKRRPPNKPIDVFKFIIYGENEDDCWGWTGGLVGRDSRPYFSIDGKKLLAYRIVYELVTGEQLSSDVLIRHTCDNHVCCNPRHLEKGDHRQNMQDMTERNRHGMPVNAVKHIKRLILKQVPYKVIAERYGCSASLISEIANGRAYKNVSIQDGRYNDELHNELEERANGQEDQ